MEKYTPTEASHLSTFAADAEALISATADIAGDKVCEARKRLSAALEHGKHLLVRAEERAIEGAKLTDQVVRQNPYQAIAIAAGVGAIVGYLASRRGCSKSD